MPKPLDARIAAAMGNGARAATVTELINELSEAITATEIERDRLDALSKSATASEDEADKAADDAAKLARKVVRLGAKRDQMQARHEELMNSERRRRAIEEHSAVMARRDQLVDDLRSEMPGLIDTIVGFLERIEASEAECAALNRSCEYGTEWLEGAEALARGCPGNFRVGDQWVPRLTGLKIPAFDASERFDVAWPKPVNHFAATQRLADSHRSAKLARDAEIAKLKRYVVSPPRKREDAVTIATQAGDKRVHGAPSIHLMSPEQAAKARAAGCSVDLAKAGQTIGMPAGVSTF